MVVFPNAKINIGLNILDKRPDGYHDIDTLFYPVGWTDVLEIVPSKHGDTTLEVTGDHVDCPTEQNLVMRAYRALSEKIELPPVEMHLEKIIPHGAGLGGGSSDAAFALKTLNGMSPTPLSDHELAAVAAGLGADCTFFIYDKPMTATGIGDRLTPFDIDLSMYNVLIVKPPVGVSTREAYAGVTPRHPDIELKALLKGDVEVWQGRVLNDFEPTVFAQHPELAAIRDFMGEMGALYTSMSGSGSAIYGIYRLGCDILTEMAQKEWPDCLCWTGALTPMVK